MVNYDKEEQEQYQKAFEEAVKEAYAKYVEYTEGVFGYGCREQQNKESFIIECEDVLEIGLDPEETKKSAIKRALIHIGKKFKATNEEMQEALTEVLRE